MRGTHHASRQLLARLFNHRYQTKLKQTWRHHFRTTSNYCSHFLSFFRSKYHQFAFEGGWKRSCVIISSYRRRGVNKIKLSRSAPRPHAALSQCLVVCPRKISSRSLSGAGGSQRLVYLLIERSERIPQLAHHVWSNWSRAEQIKTHSFTETIDRGQKRTIWNASPFFKVGRRGSWAGMGLPLIPFEPSA